MKYKITDEQLEEIVRIADDAGNLVAASQIPVAAHIHLEGLRHGLTGMETALRELYDAISAVQKQYPD